MDRREFAKRLALAASVLPLVGAADAAFAQPPPANQPTPTPDGHASGMTGFYQRLADNETELAAINPKVRREIVMLAYPGMFPLDLIGPHSVLSGLPNTRVQIAWKTKAPITFAGFSITPSATFDECPDRVDVLFVPGGGPGTFAALNDEVVLQFLQSRGSTAKYVTSVCTGSLVLAAAGLLHGKQATTHWVAFPALEKLGAVPVHQRIVEDGNRITAAGVSSGIDFALQLASRLTTPTFAKAMQLNIEYDPQPPFDAGSPEKAGPRIAGALIDMYAPMMAAGMRTITSRRG